jgi:ribosomal protein L37E
METKRSSDYDYEYGAKYCFDIINWNLNHLSSSVVVVDNLTCFQPIEGVFGSTSIFFNQQKNELTFRCNFMQHFICSEITNKKKYKLFSIQEFINHFVYFYSLIDKVMRLRPVQYCDTCLAPSYQAKCKRCYVESIVSAHHQCSSCERPAKKKSKFLSWFGKK